MIECIRGCGRPAYRRAPWKGHPNGYGKYCHPCMRLRHQTGDYRSRLEPLYRRIGRADAPGCYVCGEALGADATEEHVPSLASVRELGVHGPMLVVWSHAACNRGEPPVRLMLA